MENSNRLSIGVSPRGIGLLLVLVSCASLAIAQNVEPAPNCPTHATLTLDNVVGLAQGTATDDRVVLIISQCHIGFAMNPAALERVSEARDSRKILDALNRDTLPRLSLAQARAEVAALEASKEQNQASSKTNDALEYRMEFLKQSLYPAEAQPQYIGYFPDDARMVVQIGGQEFSFIVAPGRAKAMHDNWGAVKVMQPYAEEDSHERYLEEASNIEPVLGRPSVAVQPPPSAGKAAPIQVGEFVCPGAVLMDMDAALDRGLAVVGVHAVPTPDRVITAPTRIVEVAQGFSLFRLADSRTIYALKSGPPPQSVCSQGGADGSSIDAVLTVRISGIARVRYWLLRDDLRTALSKGGLLVPVGMSPGRFILSCDDLSACMRPVRADMAAETIADANGMGIFPSVASGTYFLFIMVVHPDRTVVWNRRIDLKPGKNVVALIEQNATETLATGGRDYVSDTSLTVRNEIFQNMRLVTSYSLLREDLRAVFVKGGIRIPVGMAPGMFLIESCGKHSSSCNDAADLLKKDTVATADTDLNGTGTFPELTPGTYFLFMMGNFGTQTLVWNQRVSLKPGANSIVLNQQNAAEAF